MTDKANTGLKRPPFTESEFSSIASAGTSGGQPASPFMPSDFLDDDDRKAAKLGAAKDLLNVASRVDHVLDKLPGGFEWGQNGAENLASEVFKIDRRAEAVGSRVKTLVDYRRDAAVLSHQALSVPRYDKVGRQVRELGAPTPRQSGNSRGGVTVHVDTVMPQHWKGFMADLRDRVRGAALEGGH